MATDPTAPAVTFTNPVLRARLAFVRCLQLVDAMENAAARDDYWTVQALARQAQDRLGYAQSDILQVVTDMENAQAALARALVDPDDDAHQDALDLEAAQGEAATAKALEALDVWAEQGKADELTQAELRGQWGDR